MGNPKPVQLSEKQIEIIRFIQGDLPCVTKPYADLAAKLNMTEQEIVDQIQWMLDQGVVRRFGMAVRHQNIGYTANGMSAWDVPDGMVDEVGSVLAALPEVTHCYERARFGGWPYNLYAMIHGKKRETVLGIAKDISEKIGLTNYKVLFSTKEYKRTSMSYFVQED